MYFKKKQKQSNNLHYFEHFRWNHITHWIFGLLLLLLLFEMILQLPKLSASPFPHPPLILWHILQFDASQITFARLSFGMLCVFVGNGFSFLLLLMANCDSNGLGSTDVLRFLSIFVLQQRSSIDTRTFAHVHLQSLRAVALLFSANRVVATPLD